MLTLNPDLGPGGKRQGGSKYSWKSTEITLEALPYECKLIMVFRCQKNRK